jgi:hypothetical protein
VVIFPACFPEKEEWMGQTGRRVQDRSRSMGRKLRAITRTIRRRSGEAKGEVLALTEQTGQLLERSVSEARRLAVAARRRARGRGARAKLKAASRLEELADRCEKVAAQIRQRVVGVDLPLAHLGGSQPSASNHPLNRAACRSSPMIVRGA